MKLNKNDINQRTYLYGDNKGEEKKGIFNGWAVQKGCFVCSRCQQYFSTLREKHRCFNAALRNQQYLKSFRKPSFTVKLTEIAAIGIITKVLTNRKDYATKKEAVCSIAYEIAEKLGFHAS